MTRDEALARADAIMEELLRSGNRDTLFPRPEVPDGMVDLETLLDAAFHARQRIADEIMAAQKVTRDGPAPPTHHGGTRLQ